MVKKKFSCIVLTSSSINPSVDMITGRFIATVKLGYNDHGYNDQGYNEFTAITNKYNSTFLVPNGTFTT